MDRVKEALFNIIQSYIYEAEILDLFSGSGALAIESISRGAKSAISCDSSRKAIQIIRKNVEKAHFEQYIEIMNKDYKRCLEDIKHKKFDIIFLDPPYKTDFGIDAVKIILSNINLKENGIIILETDRDEGYIKKLEEFAKIIDLRKYGRVKLVFLGRKE